MRRIIGEHVKDSYRLKRHDAKKIQKLFDADVEYNPDGSVWYKIVDNFINQIFDEIRNTRINVKILELKSWAERIFSDIFFLRLIPHVNNLESEFQEAPYFSYVEVDVSKCKNSDEITTLLINAVFLHQIIRKIPHNMFTVKDGELLKDERLLYKIKYQNQKICRKLNKVPKMPRVFVIRDKESEIRKFLLA